MQVYILLCKMGGYAAGRFALCTQATSLQNASGFFSLHFVRTYYIAGGK